MREQTLTKLFDAMQVGKGVPAQESTVNSVLQSLQHTGNGKGALVSQVVEDFALTQKVLKLAHSAMYAPFVSDNTSVAGALDIVGADGLLHIVLSTDVVSAAQLADDSNLSKTLLASELARSVLVDRSDDASVAALMWDLGRLMTTRYLPDASALIDTAVVSGSSPEVAATAVLGLTLQQVGEAIAQRWRLPPAICALIDGSGDPDLTAVARFAGAAAALIHAGNAEGAQALVAALKVPGIDKSKIAALVQHKVLRTTPAPTPLPIALPLPLPMAPTESAEAELAQLFEAIAKEKRANLEDLANAMFPNVAHALQTAHCLLFMMTRTGDFRVRYGYGKGIDELKLKFRLSAEFQPTAFHAVIKNNVDVSIDDITRLKPSALPDGYRELLPNVKKFVVLPIANQRVSGLVYCDWDVERSLDRSELAALKKLRNLLLPFFPA